MDGSLAAPYCPGALVTNEPSEASDMNLDEPVALPPPNMDCNVLRCSNRREYTIDISPFTDGEAPPHELAVCPEHYMMIDAGEEYYAPGYGRVMFMGQDLASLGLKRITGGGITISDDRLGSVDDYLRYLTLQYETIGNESDTGEVKLLLTPEARGIIGMRPQG